MWPRSSSVLTDRCIPRNIAVSDPGESPVLPVETREKLSLQNRNSLGGQRGVYTPEEYDLLSFIVQVVLPLLYPRFGFCCKGGLRGATQYRGEVYHLINPWPITAACAYTIAPMGGSCCALGSPVNPSEALEPVGLYARVRTQMLRLIKTHVGRETNNMFLGIKRGNVQSKGNRRTSP